MNRTQCINPANGEILGSVAVDSPSQLSEIIANARNAQRKWSSLHLSEKIKKLKKIRDYIVNNAESIAEIISADNGKTKIDALATEVIPAAMSITYYCKRAKSFLKETNLSAGNILLINKRSRIVRVPYGVVGIISPWNYPFSIPFGEIIKALLAGNAVLLKTATETQMVGMQIKKAIESAQLPENIFSYLNISGKEAGDAFLESGVDKLFFTGSVEVGKYLMKKSAETLTPINLELGGNDAMIVCDDADLERASNGALWAGFSNAGQSCGGVERIYVHSKVYNDFLLLLKQKIENLRLGIGNDYNSDMGCLTTQKQFNLVLEHIEEAKSKGAIVYAESKLPTDKELKNFLPASVLTNVNHDMRLMREETFGPIVGVMKFNSYEEAINLANDSNLGLTGSVWTKSSKLGNEIAQRINAGVITINDHLMSHGLTETPWGGIKESGIGRTHGKIGFDEMTYPKVIVKDILPFVKRNLWWHPYNFNVFAGLNGMLNFLYSKSFSLKVTGLIKLVKLFPRMFRK
jgi:succinate-semialdehyde dehydrogenase/glutarate-semialdehyde dehydrogenase